MVKRRQSFCPCPQASGSESAQEDDQAPGVPPAGMTQREKSAGCAPKVGGISPGFAGQGRRHHGRGQGRRRGPRGAVARFARALLGGGVWAARAVGGVRPGTLLPPARGGPAGRGREAAPDGWFAHHAASGWVESLRPTADPGHRTQQKTDQPPVQLSECALAQPQGSFAKFPSGRPAT